MRLNVGEVIIRLMLIWTDHGTFTSSRSLRRRLCSPNSPPISFTSISSALRPPRHRQPSSAPFYNSRHPTHRPRYRPHRYSPTLYSPRLVVLPAPPVVVVLAPKARDRIMGVDSTRAIRSVLSPSSDEAGKLTLSLSLCCRSIRAQVEP